MASKLERGRCALERSREIVNKFACVRCHKKRNFVHDFPNKVERHISTPRPEQKRGPGSVSQVPNFGGSRKLAVHYVKADDGLVAARTDADVADRRAGELLQAEDVVLGFLREFFEGGAAGDVLVPGRHRFVDGGGVVEVGLGQRHFVVADAVDVVGDADRDFADAGEDVELGQEVVGEAVDAGGVAGDDGVVPAAAALAAGVHADFAAGFLQVFAPLIKQLGRERARADARGVRLDDAQGRRDLGRADAGADAGAAGGRVGGGHERVGAVVDVEHGGLAAFHEDVLAFGQSGVEDVFGVDNHGLEAFGVGHEVVHHCVGFDGAAVVHLDQHLVLDVQRRFDLLAED